jgi:hypothetical protein
MQPDYLRAIVDSHQQALERVSLPDQPQSQCMHCHDIELLRF